jgi:DNA-binding transcriptional LysR family regulator
MDRLEAMSAFAAVAELGGFATAARRLGVSGPTVTRLVAALEERLGIRLLQRTTRSVKLTDAGARYLERARRILVAVEEAEGTARAEQTEPTGRLVVTAPEVLGRQEVAPLMSDFLVRYPAVTGELLLTDRLVSLVDEGVDLAVRIGVLEDSSLRVRPAGATRRVVVGSPAYFTGRARPRLPRHLTTHSIIQFTSLSPTPEWRFFRDGEELRQPLRPALVTNSAEVAVGHARRGAGLSMVLAYQVADLVKAGELEIVLAGHEPPPQPIQLVYPAARLVSASVRAFIELTLATRRWNFVEI